MVAFGRMLLNAGAYGEERILSRLSVEFLAADPCQPRSGVAIRRKPVGRARMGWSLDRCVAQRKKCDPAMGKPDAA